MVTNYYHLTKKELSFISYVEQPIRSFITEKRVSSPVVVLFQRDVVVRVFSLKHFKAVVRFNPSYLDGLRCEIHAMC